MQKNRFRSALGNFALAQGLALALLGSPLHAEEATQHTEASAKELTGNLEKSLFSVQPQAGLVAYRDDQNDATSRMAYGFTLDSNLLKVMDPTPTRFFVGPSTGFIYSHMGSSSSDFFGSDDGTRRSPGANLLMIPVDLKIGFAVRDNFRLSARAGGNITYRSIGNSVDWGDSSSELGGSGGWRMFPNAGLDLEIGVGKNTSLLIRPDYTITPGTDFFTGTLGLGINLG